MPLVSVERILVLGTGQLARSLIAEIGSQRHGNLKVIGVVGDKETVMDPGFGCQFLGLVNDLHHIVADNKPDRIVVALSERRQCLPVDQLVDARIRKHVVVETGAEMYERLSGKVAIESLVPSNVLFTREFLPSAMDRRIARCLSILLAAIGVVCCLPLFGLLAIAIRLDSPGPALFAQTRIGRYGRRFTLWKFRSMQLCQERRSEWAGDNVDRITRVGRWLRKFRLDELPQLFNVLRGDMNLVGPRPHPASNFEMFVLVSRNAPYCGGQIPFYSLRSSVLPGITGWAQVRYKYANGLDEEIEKLRYDLYYVKHCSVWLDLRILLETVKVVLLGRGSVEQSGQASSQAVSAHSHERDASDARSG